MNMKKMRWETLEIGNFDGNLFDIACESEDTACYLCKDNTWKTPYQLKDNTQSSIKIDWYRSKKAAEKQLKAYFDKHPKYFAKYSAARMLKGVTT